VLSALAIATSFTTRVLTASIDPVHAMRGTDARMEAIAWGVLAACLLNQYRAGGAQWIGKLGYDWTPALAAGLFLGSFAVPDGWPELIFRPTLWALAAVLVLLYGMLPRESGVKTAFFKVVAWRPIQIIGLASYSIYLIHFELRAVIRSLVGDSLPIGVVRLLVIVAGIAGGTAIYYLVEIPASRLRNIPAMRAERAVKKSSPQTL
jgi:peptidoglycan/LPS O-acetylase OafA/YrhL